MRHTYLSFDIDVWCIWVVYRLSEMKQIRQVDMLYIKIYDTLEQQLVNI